VKPANRFQKLLDKYEGDPRYIAEGLLVDTNEQVVRLMEQRGVNRTQLAALLDVSSAYVTKLLKGNENLTIKQLVRLSAALDSSVNVEIVPRQFKATRMNKRRDQTQSPAGVRAKHGHKSEAHSVD
jgi:plasmid maintenance system antidote protein VapI